MGEEYGEETPFQYFTSHSDPALAEAVRQGRRAEFAAFHAAQEVPDPQDPATFQRSKLNYALRHAGRHSMLTEFYREALRLRRELAPIAFAEKDTMHVIDMPHEQTVCIHYWAEDVDVFVALCFAAAEAPVELPLPSGTWRKQLDSAEERWSGPGSSVPISIHSAGRANLTLPATSCVVFHQQNI
jgi:maltooligosyltrehalose trehalohydrolase